MAESDETPKREAALTALVERLKEKEDRGDLDSLPLLKALGQALDLAARDPVAWEQAAAAAARERQAALANYDRAIELNPTLAQAYIDRATVNLSLGRINEARADYQQALFLAQESGNNDLAEKLKDILGNNEV